MNFKSVTIAACLALLAAGLAGCGSGGSDAPRVVVPPPPPPPVAFTGFVKTQFANTADDSDPASVDGTDFAFDDNDDSGAYDGLLRNP